MAGRVVVVNTHPVENPEFVDKLAHFLNSLGVEPQIVEGYGDQNPLDDDPSHIILTGVPMSAAYSLAESETQRVVDRDFAWLRECKCPVLGICYGHQILAHIFGGQVSSLPGLLRDARLSLTWKPDPNGGIFSGVGSLQVFAEHSDFVSKIPPGFKVLCQIDDIPYIMFHPEREMVGVQFVPEQSDARSKDLLKRFVRR